MDPHQHTAQALSALFGEGNTPEDVVDGKLIMDLVANPDPLDTAGLAAGLGVTVEEALAGLERLVALGLATRAPTPPEEPQGERRAWWQPTSRVLAAGAAWAAEAKDQGAYEEMIGRDTTVPPDPGIAQAREFVLVYADNLGVDAQEWAGSTPYPWAVILSADEVQEMAGELIDVLVGREDLKATIVRWRDIAGSYDVPGLLPPHGHPA